MNKTISINPPLPTKKGVKTYWNNLPGASLAYTITEASKLSNAPFIIITADTASAHRLERELKSFTNEKILSFPDWETLPYDNFSPHQDIISERLTTLTELSLLSKGILIVPIPTFLHKIAPRSYIDALSWQLEVGQIFSIDNCRIKLVNSGYRLVSSVMEHGEFAIRGSIIDIFPMGSENPIRIDLFGDTIDTLRWFDSVTQRSITKTDKIHLLPAREFPLTPEAIAFFRQSWRERFEGAPLECPIYQDISSGIASKGIEYYLPLFFKEMAMLMDYFPQNSTLILLEKVNESAEQFWQSIVNRYEQLRHDLSRPILPPTSLFMPVQEVMQKLKDFLQIEVQIEKVSTKSTQPHFDFIKSSPIDIESKGAKPLHKLEELMDESAKIKRRILFCAETAGRRETLLELLAKIQIHPKQVESVGAFLESMLPIGITIAPIDEGFTSTLQNFTLIAEGELYGRRVMQRRRRATPIQDPDFEIRNLAELTLGSPIVHIEHGVGRYIGLQALTVGNRSQEFVTLEYAGGDKLYLPVTSLHLISRYSSTNVENAPLNKLGTDTFEKAKRKAQARAKDVAVELLEIYAKRALKTRASILTPEEQYIAFANAFPFEETPDQARAIADILSDLANDKPMDRLICGDVGFGKTEVAMRAAFITANNNKQVAILVPTTLLAQQHFETFKDRMADWPIRIEVLSRFVTSSAQHKIIDDLSNGKVDIVIGTHKLLQSDIKFNNLGLLIIDEEHRFGVSQKEKLKALRAEVDILTLTATPIPRTLNLALSTLRDLSIIATPPAKRLSIKTFVREYQKPLVIEAILRELARGGQVYYLHNNVETIEKTAHEISVTLPEARIGIAHGQMHERELEQVMSDFYHQRFNLLVCTTIIETGIDVPSANTIIIERADKLGLAQLHQLRGRVGRSHHQAYAYCLTPPTKTITKDALKRLEALESLEDLGAGFSLATHDLEIRGAGEILGDEQSGNMQAVGFSLYMEMLERTIFALKQGKNINEIEMYKQPTEVDLQIATIIPDDYLPDVHNRLVLYKRISNAKNMNSLEELQVEMIDRFGLLPPETKNLFKVTSIKLKAEPLGIKKIELGEKGGKIDFYEKPAIDANQLIALIQKEPKVYHPASSTRLTLSLDLGDIVKRVQFIESLLTKITPN